MSHARLVDSFSVILSFFMWTLTPYDLSAVFFEACAKSGLSILFRLPYKRELETEADHVGLILCARVLAVFQLLLASISLLTEQSNLTRRVLMCEPAPSFGAA